MPPALESSPGLPSLAPCNESGGHNQGAAGAAAQATQAYAEGKQLPASQLDALQRLRDIQTIFEGRMMRLQPLLALFHDF